MFEPMPSFLLRIVVNGTQYCLTLDQRRLAIGILMDRVALEPCKECRLTFVFSSGSDSNILLILYQVFLFFSLFLFIFIF